MLFRYLITIILFSCCSNTVYGEISVGLDFGKQNAELSWNIAGDSSGCCPNVLSELTWSNLNITRVDSYFSISIVDALVIRAGLGVGEIMSGENQDSDYLCDNRACEFSRSIAEVSGDEILDASIAVGYIFYVVDENTGNKARIVPLIGYSHHEQHLRVINGVQIIPSTGAFSGLNSTYQAQWQGPWFGINLELEANETSGLNVGYEYHLPDYYAEANWNLRTELVTGFMHPKSFEHIADGKGNVLKIYIWNRKTMKIGWHYGFEFHKFSAVNGIDRTFNITGAIYETRLNEVKYQANIFKLGFNYYF